MLEMEATLRPGTGASEEPAFFFGLYRCHHDDRVNAESVKRSKEAWTKMQTMEKPTFILGNRSLKAFRVSLLNQKAEILMAQALNFRRLADLEREKTALAESHGTAFTARRVNRVLSGKLTRIEEALDRMDSGTFGNCVLCGESISTDHLQAVPWERFCIHCKEKRNYRSNGSIVQLKKTYATHCT